MKMNNSSRPQALIRLVLAAGLLITVSFACRKTDLAEKPAAKRSLKTATSQKELFIDIEDVYAALPQVIMNNLNATLYVGRAEWKYIDDGIMVRIPTSEGNNGYIYASKTVKNPDKVNVYAVKFYPDETVTGRGYSGKEVWIDLQDWKAYGVAYKEGVPVSHMEPQVLAQPDWEVLTTMHGHYKLMPMAQFHFRNPDRETQIVHL